MYAIALTSIPPRLPRLGPVLKSLCMQRPAPVGVYLYLPKVWDRFDAMLGMSNVPKGVTIRIEELDLGPCMKATSFACHPLIDVPKLIYCDDDWIYPQGWASALLGAGLPGEAVAASGFTVDRLKRHGASKHPDFVDIAQGFGGVSIDPKWLRFPDSIPPPAARFADDVWLSGQLARQGVPIRLCKDARAGLRPAFEDDHGLQDMDAPGQSRAEANRAALDALTRKYGIWPAL